METLGPGWQMMDPFGLWWTVFNETLSISFFLTGGLNGGVKFDLVIRVFFKFHVWKFDKNEKWIQFNSNLAPRSP